MTRDPPDMGARTIDRDTVPGSPPIARGGIVLCADDYGMTAGVTRSILELADAGRLSAASAMTTMRAWQAAAPDLRGLRGKIATGLHLNLTLGAPLSPMPSLAPDFRFPGIGAITAQAMVQRLNHVELRDEIARQCAAFEDATGHPPDHIDGHQHVHALPQVRDALIDVLVQRYGKTQPKPLVRDPTDRLIAIAARSQAVPKAMMLSWLGRGFGSAVRAAGFPINTSFAGVTGFAAATVLHDFKAAATSAGTRHLVMCHPGYVDDELVRIDPVTERRRAEHEVLMGEGYPSAIWRVQRPADGPPVDWVREWAQTDV